jgi:metal-responsive CopG/Arc/MetJ family transcriptional regulator
MKTIAITIDEDMLRRIDRLVTKGEATVKNRSQVIRQAVREYVARLERLAEEEREREVFRRHRQLLERQARALVEEQAKL